MVNLGGAALHKKQLCYFTAKKQKRNGTTEQGKRGREKEKRCSHTHYLLLQVKCVFVSATETAVRALTL